MVSRRAPDGAARPRRGAARHHTRRGQGASGQAGQGRLCPRGGCVPQSPRDAPDRARRPQGARQRPPTAAHRHALLSTRRRGCLAVASRPARHVRAGARNPGRATHALTRRGPGPGCPPAPRAVRGQAGWCRSARTRAAALSRSAVEHGGRSPDRARARAVLQRTHASGEDPDRICRRPADRRRRLPGGELGGRAFGRGRGAPAGRLLAGSHPARSVDRVQSGGRGGARRNAHRGGPSRCARRAHAPAGRRTRTAPGRLGREPEATR